LIEAGIRWRTSGRVVAIDVTSSLDTPPSE
jgi:hypothetical protein